MLAARVELVRPRLQGVDAAAQGAVRLRVVRVADGRLDLGHTPLTSSGDARVDTGEALDSTPGFVESQTPGR